MSVGARIGWVITLLLLLCTGFLGLYNGFTEWKTADTALQKSVTAGVFLYGLLGFVAFAGLLLRKRWSVSAVLGWGIVVTYVAGAAVIAYGGPDASAGGALAGSVATAAIAAVMTWVSVKATRSGLPQKNEGPVG